MLQLNLTRNQSPLINFISLVFVLNFDAVKQKKSCTQIQCHNCALRAFKCELRKE